MSIDWRLLIFWCVVMPSFTWSANKAIDFLAPAVRAFTHHCARPTHLDGCQEQLSPTKKSARQLWERTGPTNKNPSRGDRYEQA